MKNPIPRLAAIHDLSGLGKVSLMVVIPILSTMGVQVTPLVTAVLSSNTEYADFKMLDLTEQMTMFFEHWKNEGIKLDAIYSGFLGSDKQIDIVKEFIDFYKHELWSWLTLFLGDDGKPYAPMSLKLIEEMKKLICKANLITQTQQKYVYYSMNHIIVSKYRASKKNGLCVCPNKDLKM